MNEDETKQATEINPDTLDAVFEETIIEEDELFFVEKDEEEDEKGVDIAFQANDEGYW